MRVLYISYFYPPLGGPAVLRNVKTVKYLSRMGYSVDVITIDDIEYLYRDKSLLDECGHRNIWRTGSLDPMALLKKLGRCGGGKASRLYMDTPERLKLMIRRAYPIDDKIGWVPFLVRAGNKALRENAYDLIYISMGPFSSGIGAYRLATRSGLPLVLDMRDYWNLLGDYDLQGSAWQRRYSRHWEAKLYQRADMIVTATEGIGQDIASAFGTQHAAKLLTVYNGYDEEDFEGLMPNADPDAFVMAYFGNIYARRTLAKYFAALRSLRDSGALPPNTRVKLYGNFFRETLKDIEQSGIGDMIEVIPQLEHRDALQAMLDADVLLLTLNSSGPRGTLSSKVFEYLRAGKPILAMVPAHNEAAALLRDCGQSYICAMESADSIRNALTRLIADRDNLPEYPAPEHLERGRQIAKLAEALQRVKY